MQDDPVNEIEVVVESVRVHMLSSRHVVILKDAEHDRYLPIWIGPWEASAIAMRLQGLSPERPLTHDLFASVLGDLGARLERVRITTLADETFHARLVLVLPDARHEVDARPSDAIALAVRLGAPIYAAEAVLDQAALGADSAADETEEGRAARRSGSTLDATDEPIDPTRLDIFREFVNSLDAESDQRGGPGSSS
jgi:bifunctional DNase/RNase